MKGAQGDRGPAGFPGATGAPGAPGAVSQTVEALGPIAYSSASGGGAEVQSSKAECPAGTIVTGGGFDTGIRDFVAYAVKSGNGYFVISINSNEFDGSSIQAQAICGAAGAAAVRARTANRSRVKAAEAAKLAEIRAQIAQ